MKRDLLEKIKECIEQYKEEKNVPVLNSEELAESISDAIDEYEEEKAEEEAVEENDEDLESLYRY